jgi:4'-phosphopantetheinyl transferase
MAGELALWWVRLNGAPAEEWLRRLLARELGVAAADVPIVVAEGGKPELAGGELHFSLARSEGVALFALSATTEVGVDLEAITTGTDMEGVAARFFSPSERGALAALPEAERLGAAYGCWARKEAYAKAIGTGLTFDLANAEVGVGGAAPGSVEEWTIHDVAMELRFAAAVAGRWPAGWAPPAPRAIDASQTNTP